MALFLSWVLLSFLWRGNIGSVWDMGNILLIVFTYYLTFRERIILIENAKYRKLEPVGYQKICCPLWWRVLHVCSTVLQTWLFVFGYFLGIVFDLSKGQVPDVSYPWEIGYGIAFIALLICHVLSVKYHFSIVDMGDADLTVTAQDIMWKQQTE